MTVNDAKIELFKYFSNNELLNLDEDFSKVILVSLEPEIDKEIVAAGLKEFESQGLIVSLNVKTQEGVPPRVWVLVKPLIQYSQTIELKYQTLAAISEIINGFCDIAGDDHNKVDPLNVTEHDIQNLVVLYHTKNQQVDE